MTYFVCPNAMNVRSVSAGKRDPFGRKHCGNRTLCARVSGVFHCVHIFFFFWVLDCKSKLPESRDFELFTHKDVEAARQPAPMMG